VSGRTPANVVPAFEREPGAALDAEAVIGHARSLLASYKKPRRVVFVEAVPRAGRLPDYAALDAEHGGGGYPGE